MDSCCGRGSITLGLLLKRTTAKFLILFYPRPHRLSSGHNQDNQWQDTNWVYYGGRCDRRAQPFYVTQLIAASVKNFRSIGLFMVFIRDCPQIHSFPEHVCFGQWCWSNETQAQELLSCLLPLFQNDSSCEPFLWKCVPPTYERFYTRIRLETGTRQLRNGLLVVRIGNIVCRLSGRKIS